MQRFMYGLCNYADYAVSSSDHIASEGRKISEWIGKDVEGSSYSLTEALCEHFPQGTEGNNENPQSE
jgi:hypothetical protein